MACLPVWRKRTYPHSELKPVDNGLRYVTSVNVWEYVRPFKRRK